MTKALTTTEKTLREHRYTDKGGSERKLTLKERRCIQYYLEGHPKHPEIRGNMAQSALKAGYKYAENGYNLLNLDRFKGLFKTLMDSQGLDDLRLNNKLSDLVDAKHTRVYERKDADPLVVEYENHQVQLGAVTLAHKLKDRLQPPVSERDKAPIVQINITQGQIDGMKAYNDEVKARIE